MKIIVIGGGPAGMMAAIHAKNDNNEVILFEQNNSLGKKLLITGNRRCNITNNKQAYALIKLLHNGKFLTEAFNHYDVNSIINFYRKYDLELHEENDNKMYPITNRAIDVLNVFKQSLKDNGICVKLNSKVTNINVENDAIKSVTVNDKDIECDHLIIATGGVSFPKLGSDGNMHRLLKTFNIESTKLFPVEAPLLSKDKVIKQNLLVGMSFSNIELTVHSSSKKKAITKHVSDMIFTHQGISGPAALISSEAVYKILLHDEAYIVINFLPHIKQNSLIDQLVSSKQNVSNTLSNFLPKRYVEYIINDNNIEDGVFFNQLSNSNKEKIYNSIYRFKLNISSVGNIERAFITGGGLNLEQINPNTLTVNSINNLSVCGELLDIHGPIGGYNLTIAQISGMLAGNYVRSKKPLK